MSAFTSRVLSIVRRIPAGRVATYGDVAAAAGYPRAARAVGTVMRDCRFPDVPCHRVVAAAGRLGGYGGQEAMKRALLRAEGVLVAGSTIRDFGARRCSFRSPRPPAAPGGGAGPAAPRTRPGRRRKHNGARIR